MLHRIGTSKEINNWNIKAKPAQDLPLLIDQQPHHPQHDHRDLLTTHSSHQICSLFLHCHWAWMIQTRKESQIYPARITEGTDDFYWLPMKWELNWEQVDKQIDNRNIRRDESMHENLDGCIIGERWWKLWILLSQQKPITAPHKGNMTQDQVDMWRIKA